MECLTGTSGYTVHLAFQSTGKLSHSLSGRSGLLSVTVGAPYVTA